jgi:LAS superfamily LD-carboxypeptidase LdcB/pimeloyl-ACP methyl ester carboxylesterase
LKKIRISVKKIKTKIFWYFLSKRFKVFLWILFWALIVCYILLIIFARPIETLITFPGKDINLKEFTNHPAGIINAEFFDIPSSSGNNIHGLYIDMDAEKTVYYFHGNGAPMDHFYTEMRYITDLWYNLISYDFPGYGKSTGEPTQSEVLHFSHEFYKAMQIEKNIKNEDLIVWGYSIGTAVAIDFAKDIVFDKLVLFAPLASRYDMSAKLFGFPIQKMVLRENSFISKQTIKHIPNPTLIVHGNKDVVVPFAQWKQVFKNSPAEEKYFIEIDNFGHSLITERYGVVLSGYLQDFLWWQKLPEIETFLDKETASKLLWKFQKASYFKNLDLDSDSSLTKYVDPEISFSEKSYIPESMLALKRDFIADAKWNALMREQAATPFENLAEAFYEQFDEKILVVSSYRSYDYQAGIKARGCPDNLCAKAGHSEHQSWLTVDLWSASSNSYWKWNERLSGFYTWLSKNAHLYGFHNGYQNGPEIDGYEIEPWHWRYLWVKLATNLHEKDITFAEFYYSQN